MQTACVGYVLVFVRRNLWQVSEVTRHVGANKYYGSPAASGLKVKHHPSGTMKEKKCCFC